ncbi:hypothetical protein [Providencia phage Kokobel2]|nr:hypothetical protein [Providencia phage Kokobel2]
MIETPPWLEHAHKFIGLREIKGPQHAPEILQMWKDIKRGGIKDDETPWCAAFVGAMLERSGITSTRFEGALSYLKWGADVGQPRYGAVAVGKRTGGGHVGFVVGITANGDPILLGGNQNDSVSIAAYPKANVVGYRYPKGWPVDMRPLAVGTAQVAKSFA